MKAIRVQQFGDPSVMKLEDVPEKSPGAGQVLVDVKAAGVNPVDTYIRSGQYASLPPLPYTPGCDAAGVVAAVGSDVADVKAGDRVYFSGTVEGRAYGSYAQRALCTIDQVHRLPTPRVICRGRRCRCAVRHGVAGALRQGTRGAGRDGSGSWRERRRGRCCRADGQRRRIARFRHGRY